MPPDSEIRAANSSGTVGDAKSVCRQLIRMGHAAASKEIKKTAAQR